LIVPGSVAFYGREFWIVKALWTFAAGDDDLALVKL
jgi:hypothetical protein